MISPGLALEVAERHGTPAYAYDLREVDARLRELRETLPEARLLYVLGGMSGLGRLIPARPSFTVPAGGSGAGRAPTDLCGPLCTPVDVPARSVELDGVSPGALLAVPNVGAYGLTASLVGFLSRRPPAEVVVEGDRIVMARRLTLEYTDSR